MGFAMNVSTIQLLLFWAMPFFLVFRTWANIKGYDEAKKYITLAAGFFLIIGVYWSLRPMKDGLFASIIGAKWQPAAKMLSMFAVFPIVMIYSKLVDKFRRQTVFYILTIFYALTAFIFAWLFMHPTIGLSNTVESPGRLLGWVWYIWVESYGSLVVALFWGFLADITLPDVAKRVYPVVILFGQLGNFMGPFYTKDLAKQYFNGNNGPVVAILGCFILMITFIIWLFYRIVPADQMETHSKAKDAADKEEEGEPGFFEGLFLLLKTPYLLSIFFIISFYETIVTVFDFLFKINVAEAFPASADRVAVLGDYGAWTGLVAFYGVILGINNIQRRLGMTPALLLLPILVGVAIFVTKFNASIGALMWIMVFSKAANYSLNQPTLKQLYIPTSKDAKYKSQAWIEMFGSRGSKATGSGFNALREVFINMSGSAAGVSMFLSIFLVGGLSLVTVWVPVAIYASRMYNKAIKEDTIVC